MNRVILMGRLTRDPDLRYSTGERQMAIARFTLAVDRRFKRDGEPTADFIPCVAFGKTGEFVERYFRKGMRVGVCGRIQVRSYDNNEGQRVYATEVIVEETEFCQSVNENARATETPSADGFVNIPDGLDDELPFL